MHAIRAFIRSHLYAAHAAHATPHATRAAPRPNTPGAVSGRDGTSRRRRTRAITRALVRTLRSFDPRHHGVHTPWRTPVSG